MPKHFYQVVHGAVLAKLEVEVAARLNDGWDIAGPLVVQQSTLNHMMFYYQPMVKHF